jgi:exonuclease III
MNKSIKYINILNGGVINYSCDEDAYTCPTDTKNFGLCVKDRNICNADEYLDSDVSLPKLQPGATDSEIEQIKEQEDTGIRKNYHSTYLKNSCYIQRSEPIIYDYSFKVKKTFKIATINAMGIYRGNNDVLELMKLRMEMLAEEIATRDIDIICFQEMSSVAFDLLYTQNLRKKYQFFYESDLDLEGRKKDIEVFILSKFPVKRVTIYPLEGNLGYTNSLGVYEFNNLVVVNCYLQAGSKKSPGQKYKYINYSRCRSQQFYFIKSIVDRFGEKPCVILGDFNFDLNGTVEEWPEKAKLEELGFIDSWTGGSDPSGLTENTDINTMRWNAKFETKHYRYDAILYKGPIQVAGSSRVIFDTPKRLEGKQNSYYERSILPAKMNEELSSQLRYSKKGSGSDYDLFISDHFGVMARFKLN